MAKFRKFIVTILILFVVAGVCGFAGYFIYTNYYGNNTPVIGGEPHDQTLYKINYKNGFNTLPTKGDVKILVIPVSFTDYEVYSTEANRKKIERTFFVEDENNEESYKTSNTSWYSVAQYYYLSSGGNVKIKGKVADWYNTGITTKQLIAHRTTNPEYRNSGEDGTWWLLNQAVNWYKSNNNDLDSYDTDNDNFYDLIWMVYNAPSYDDDNSLPSVFWAFNYLNLDNYSLATPQNKLPYNYCFASFHFIFEGYGDFGYDAHTFVHETGHAFGLVDYYSTTVASNGKPDCFPFGGVDMMDFNIGDHCSYSKYLLGWTSPKQVISTAGEYKLKSTSDTGEFFIVSSSFAGHPFDEYFIVEYITPTGLNYQDYTAPYKGNNLQGYSKPGIRISHIDSRGVRLISTSTGYTYTHETNYSFINGLIIHNSTTDPIYRLGNGTYCKQNTIMQKDFTTFNTSVLSENYPIGNSVNDLLFYENESFSLLGNSKYRQLMPTKTNLMNKGVEFNFTIDVVTLGEEAIISVH